MNGYENDEATEFSDKVKAAVALLNRPLFAGGSNS
jgi:hypothetical protein